MQKNRIESNEKKSTETIDDEFAKISLCDGPVEDQTKLGDVFHGVGVEECPKRRKVRKLYKYENDQVIQNEIVDEDHPGNIPNICRSCTFCAKECKLIMAGVVFHTYYLCFCFAGKLKCQCKKAYYCNLKCQQADYERHRMECSVALANEKEVPNPNQ